MPTFDDIRPFTDSEALEALKRVAASPRVDRISEYFSLNPDKLRKLVLGVHSIDEFQNDVMIPMVGVILRKTSDGLTYSGIDNLRIGGKRHHLIVSNHRDIVLDPSLLQYVLRLNKMDFTEVAAGNNLISLSFVSDIMRSNRMVVVKRDGTTRELYESWQRLSQYLRSRVTDAEGGSSLWIAQRQGRAKDGCDLTEQGLLKMLDMSGTSSFEENFGELSIVPLTVSYEYESCGIKKARELLIKEMTGSYAKSPFEDMESIITGIRQKKGRIHLHFGEPISAAEYSQCASLNKNDRYRHLAEIIDHRIALGYKIWPTAQYASDMLEGKIPNPDFAAYIDNEVASVRGEGLPEERLRTKLLQIFAAPLRNL